MLRSTGAKVAAVHVKGKSNAAERAELLPVPDSLFIDLFQPNGRVASLLLDPRSIGSIFRYPEFAVLVCWKKNSSSIALSPVFCRISRECVEQE